MLNFGLANPSQYFADYLIGKLDRGGKISISTASLDRTFLKEIALQNVQVTEAGKPIASTTSVSLDAGIGQLIDSIVFGSTQIQATIAKPELSYEMANIESNSAKVQLPLYLQQWLNKNAFSLLANNISINLAFGNNAISLGSGMLSLSMNKNIQLDTFNASFQTSDIGIGKNSVALDSGTITYGKDDIGTLFAKSVTFTSSGAKIQGNNLIAQSTLHSLDQLRQGFEISSSLSTVQSDTSVGTFQIPSVYANFGIEQGVLKTLNTSVDSFDVRYADAHLVLPTSTIAATFADGSLAFGFSSKESAPLQLQVGDSISAEMKQLSGSGQYLDDGSFHLNGSLSSLDAVQKGNQVSASAIDVSLDASLVGGALEGVTASSSGFATYSNKETDISIASPFTANISRIGLPSVLSASIQFSNLESSFTLNPLTMQFSYQMGEEGRQLQAAIQQDTLFSFNSVYDLPTDGEGTLTFATRFKEFPIENLKPTLERYALFLHPYYGKNTTLTGNISFNSIQHGASLFDFDGKVSMEMALLAATVGKLNVDAGFTLLANLNGNAINVETLTLATSGYRLVFEGDTEINYWLPKGLLQLYSTEDGRLLAQTTFAPLPPNSYTFSASSPLQPSLSYKGTISRSQQTILEGDSQVSVFGSIYPLVFHFDTSTLTLDVESKENLRLHTMVAPPFNANLTLQEFIFPKEGMLANIQATGDLQFTFDSLDSWQLHSPNLSVSNLVLQEKTFAISSSISMTQQTLSMPDITISDNEFLYDGALQYSGTSFIELYQKSLKSPFTMSLLLNNQGNPLVQLALFGSASQVQAVLSLSSLDLGLFLPKAKGFSLEGTALGNSDLQKAISLDGNLKITDGTTTFTTTFLAHDNLLSLFDSSLIRPDFNYSGNLLSIEGSSKTILSEGRFEHLRHLSYIDQLSHLNYKASLDVPVFDTLYQLPSILKPIMGGKANLTLSLDDIQIFGEGGFQDSTFGFSLDYPSLSLFGDTLTGSYDFTTKMVDLSLNKDFALGLTAQGSADPSNLALHVKDISFPLVLINRTFLKPIYEFLDGTVEGEILLTGPLSAVRPYGQVSVDSSRSKVFWLPEDEITAKNVVATIDGERAITPIFPFLSINTVTGSTVTGHGQLETLMDGFNLVNYQIRTTSEEGQVKLWIPMQGFDVDIHSSVSGTFNLFGIGYETWLSGEGLIQDASLTLGIHDLPYWYDSAGLTSTDFTITTGRNVSFFYPNTPNPFIKASITENQKIAFTFNHLTNEFVIDGNLAFRNGEIYYFQKNFFITEGSLSLHTDALGGTNSIQPTINLRAKITDFDAQGNRVDIFMILRDSGLTNLNPQFESLPSKDINEIMEILGQNILPSGAYGQVNLYSVASLAAAATDVAGRLGYLDTSQTSNLTESIRISLGLDMFSIRSNILQNILVDALPGNTLTGSLSPLARYLNNTSIFMGKYIGRQFFLQGLFHLSAMDSSKVNRSFIAPDLAIDLEISLDWVNPLGTFSFFTQPNELSLNNILDTIGFSVTRRIVLR